MPLNLDWSKANLSRHGRMIVIEAALPLLERIGPLEKTDINPVIPINGGRQVYMLEATADSGSARRVVSRLQHAEVFPALAFGANQSLRIICRSTTAQRVKTFTLAGSLSQLDYTILLTGLAGLPRGIDLRAVGFKMTGRSHYKLDEIFEVTPQIPTSDTNTPILGNTMTPFLEAVQALLFETARAPLYAIP